MRGSKKKMAEAPARMSTTRTGDVAARKNAMRR